MGNYCSQGNQASETELRIQDFENVNYGVKAVKNRGSEMMKPEEISLYPVKEENKLQRPIDGNQKPSKSSSNKRKQKLLKINSLPPPFSQGEQPRLKFSLFGEENKLQRPIDGTKIHSKKKIKT